MRRIFIWILLSTFIVGFFADEADAARRRRRSRKRAQIINEKKLYERIGGTKTLSQIVDEWMRLNLADQRIAPFFATATAKPERLAKVRRNLSDQLCELADGPCSYKGAEMQKAHQGLAINEEQFLVFSENLFKSMQKYEVAEREKNEMLARLGEFRSDIVRESASGANGGGPAAAEPAEKSAEKNTEKN